MRVVIRDLQERPTLGAAHLRSIAECARRQVGMAVGCVGIAYVDDAQMAEHHERFFGDPSTTDVLSFPNAFETEANATGPERGEADEAPYWGDLIVCTDQAARQANELGHPYPYELLVLVLHGILHLLGYDHTRDGGKMRRLEEALRPRCVARSGLAWI